MIILVDEDGKKMLGNLLDSFLKANGLVVHQQVNQIFASARDLTPQEIAKEMVARQPKAPKPEPKKDKVTPKK